MTSVLICEDRQRVRDGLARMMSAVVGVARVDCVAQGDQLVSQYAEHPADLVLVGTRRADPAGMAAARRLLLAQPRAKVMMFGAAEDAGSITAALTGGVRGYLRWDASEQNLLGALAHTLSTTAALSTQTPARGRAGLGSQLSERELQILHRMSQGKTNAEIGHELVLAQDVIKSHARRLFPKLGAKDRAEAVAHGFRRGLIS